MSDNFEPRRGGKTGLIIVPVILLAFAAMAIYQNALTPGKVKNVFAAAPTVATAVPAVRAEVIRAEPTVDYQSQIDRAEAGQYAAQLTAIAAKQRAVDAQAAQQAAQVVLIQITQQAEQNQIIAAQIEITRQSNSIALAEEQNRAVTLAIEKERVNMEASARAVENRKNTLLAENAVKYDAAKSQADIFFKTSVPIIAGLAVLTVICYLIWTFWYKRWEASQPVVEPAAEAPYRPVVALHEHKDGIDTIKQIHPPLCDDETFREWAGRMLSNDSAAINLWEMAGSPFSKQNYPSKYYRRVFYPWLIANLLVEIETGSGRLVLSG
jgi:hypothetical protein